MQNQKFFFGIAVLFISAMLYSKWIEFSQPTPQTTTASVAQNEQANKALPVLPLKSTNTLPLSPSLESKKIEKGKTIKVITDLFSVDIGLQGAVIQSVELHEQLDSAVNKEKGFELLKNTAQQIFVLQDGLLEKQQRAPNHTNAQYTATKMVYDLQGEEQISVPLMWQSADGVRVTKTYVFSKNTYLVDVKYTVDNQSSTSWEGYLYSQLTRNEPQDEKTGFGQIPSFTGAVFYTKDEKFQKIDFDDIQNNNPIDVITPSGWVAMLQHYFVAILLPPQGENKFFTKAQNGVSGTQYQVGFTQLASLQAQTGETNSTAYQAYLGPKEQKRLQSIEKREKAEDLSLTVDYGIFTFLSDPLFTVLTWIHKIAQNWGWSIIILTFLIKLVFYPLSSASYKSMAAMRKFQPRIKTLKERYKDDKQKLQMETMALYKKEKINPVGGCLPMLIQMPVFIALYWVLVESVELRHAPFALWWQDLSSPDPYYVLPVLMGLSMWFQQKMNPTPMEDIQQKVMMILPVAMTFLFATFPQGLVLYWVTNNVLTIGQQWLIYRQHDAN